jgi:hypothetical protein
MDELQQLSEVKQRNLERKHVEVEQGLETLSRYLDGLFRVPGTEWRFGLDALIGLIPNYGDMATSLVSIYILIAGVRYGVPKITLLRMTLNVVIDYLVGVIPVIGDSFDFVWKANKWNVELIKARATGRGKGTISDWIFLFVLIGILVGALILSVVISLFIIYWVFSLLSGGLDNL